MKKLFKTSLAALLILVLLSCVAFAAQAQENELVNSECSSLIVAEEKVAEILQEYFSFRCDAVNGIANSISAIDEPLAIDAEQRALAFRSFWENQGIYIVSIENTWEMCQIEFNTIDGTISVIANEWTWANYNATGEDNFATDRMGFGTTHQLTFSISTTNGYILTNDGYSEHFVFPYSSQDHIALAPEEIATYDMYADSDPLSVVLPTTNHRGMFDLEACISYADAWANSTTNSIYGYNSNGDCANFVSQCIAAGGFQDDPSTAAGRNTAAGAAQWWHNRNGVLSTTSSSHSWRTVNGFCNYWGARYPIVNISADLSNIYPGNPVISPENTHIVICVGYDSAGRPVFNGHTLPAYHVPVTTTYYDRTVLLLSGYCNGNHVTGDYGYNDLLHWRRCATCKSGISEATGHTYTQSGTTYTCTVCGYATDDLAGIIMSVDNDDIQKRKEGL